MNFWWECFAPTEVLIKFAARQFITLPTNIVAMSTTSNTKMSDGLGSMPFDAAWQFDNSRDDCSLLSLPDALHVVEQDECALIASNGETSNEMIGIFEPLPLTSNPRTDGDRKGAALLRSVDDVALNDEVTQVTSNSRFVSPYQAGSRRLSLDSFCSSSEQIVRYPHQGHRYVAYSERSSRNQPLIPMHPSSKGSYSDDHSSCFPDDASNARDDLASLRHCYYYTGRQQQQRQQQRKRSRSPLSSSSSSSSDDNSSDRMICCMRRSEETRAQVLAQLQSLPADSVIRTSTNMTNFYDSFKSREQLLSWHNNADSYKNHPV